MYILNDTRSSCSEQSLLKRDRACYARQQMLVFFRLWQALGWIMIAVVMVLSLIPHPPQPPLLTWDKAQHGLAYGVLMFWFAQAFAGRWRWVGFLVGLGIALEFIQGWTGYREFSYEDMLANTLGVIGGLLLAITPLGSLVEWLDRALAARWKRT